MKRSTIYILLSVFTYLLSLNTSIFGQTDSSLCEKNISTLKELNKQKKYKEAVGLWKETYKNRKTYSKRVFIYGVNILSDKIEKEKDEQKKKLLTDSLMKLYDERIELFGQEGFAKGRQGVDLMRYDKGRLEEAYHLFNKSLELQELETEAAVVLCFMLAAERLYIKEVLDENEFLASYKKCNSNIESQISLCNNSFRDCGALYQTQKGINQIYFRNKPLSCPELIDRFTEYYLANRNHKERLEKLEQLLIQRKCIDTELFIKVSNRIDSLKGHTTISDPFFRKPTKEQLEKRISSIKLFLILDMPDHSRARNLFKLGLYYNQLGKKEEAKNYALQAKQYNIDFGAPYILLAVLYSNESTSYKKREIDRFAVYWTAVDKLNKAKVVDPSIKEAANKLIERYSKNFPTLQEIKKHGLKPGDSHHIGGWINETTIVRARK